MTCPRSRPVREWGFGPSQLPRPSSPSGCSTASSLLLRTLRFEAVHGCEQLHSVVSALHTLHHIHTALWSRPSPWRGTPRPPLIRGFPSSMLRNSLICSTLDSRET